MKEFIRKLKPKYNEMEETLGKMKGLLKNGVMKKKNLIDINDTKDKAKKRLNLVEIMS